MKDKAKHMAKKTRSQELTEQFKQTPEMQEWSLTAGSINRAIDPGDTVSITIKVPKEFIRLTEFLEKNRVAQGGGKPLPANEIINRIVVNELHEQLHWLVVEPAHFSYYRDLWNRFCDAQGAPEEKIPDPAQSGDKPGEEVPF